MKKNNFLLTIILTVIFGLAAGIVGEIVARGYLFNNDALLKEVNFSHDYNNQGVVIKDAKNIVIEQNVKVNETIDSVNTSIVGIFKKQATVKRSSSINFNLNNYYQLDQNIGQGLIITSDGWIISDLPKEVVSSPIDYVIITKDKNIYSIDKIIKDDLTSFSFIHILAKDLPVRKFANSDEIKNGNLVIAMDFRGNSILTSIINQQVKNSELISYSDGLSGNIILNDLSQQSFNGTFFFNLSGDIIAFADRLEPDRGGTIKPISYFTGAIKSLLKYKEIRRASLGVNYIDLTKLALIDGDSNNYLKNGAVISKDSKGVSIEKDSQAFLAGLKAGDVITSIDNVELDENNNLTKIIQQHIAGDKINIEYWRQGEKKQTEIVLKPLKL
ncbi:MAG: S1C family serine protease [Patescibacteria group bacterium]